MESIREKLIERIRENKDEDLLNELYNLLQSEEKESIQFNEEQVSKIKESEAAYKNGKIISDEEFQNKLDK